MKRTFFFILVLIQISGFGQNEKPGFSEFIGKFKDCSFPIMPDSVFFKLEASLSSTNLSRIEFDNYLRTSEDTLWKFDNNFQYLIGGKFRLGSNKIVLFYGRYFMPDDIDKQIGEVMLCVFDSDGKLLSRMPISGGYGDGLTFSSTIINQFDVEINYSKYYEDSVSKYTEQMIIDRDGLIKKK
ncbi:MAG: hypothetical protein ACXITV_12690 [Luteibaculaceae bacterium]